MSALFDTLDYVYKLKEAGVPVKQAETHAKSIVGGLFKAILLPNKTWKKQKQI